MKKSVKIILISAVLIAVAYVIIFAGYSRFPKESEFVLGLINGVILGTFITVFLSIRQLRREKKSNKHLSAEVVKLAEEKRLAQIKVARYLTQTYKLESQIKELKLFRDGVSASIKDIAGKMIKFVGEDTNPPKRTQETPCIQIRKGELVLGRPLAS